ncbi:MAG: hypothetical protein MJ147_07760 [Clostridia bacterium]|nr:hypothetical protein [Clostridia bacterium]
MKRKPFIKKIVALVLAMVMIFSVSFPANAASEKAKDYSLTFAHIFDKIWDVVADVIIKTVEGSLLKADSFKKDAFPTVEEYKNTTHEYFYEGTDGERQGSGWKLGYATESIIPTKWRLNADGKADENGMNLKGLHFFGGYFGSTVNKIYDDERIYLAILSAGDDANKNGVEDVIIIGSVDNIGIANANVREVRKAVSLALQKKGIAPDDIVAFELNSTHAHTVVEGLGMSLDTVFFTAMFNHFFAQQVRSIEPELLKTICNKAAKAATDAYDGLEDGTLYYYETENIDNYMKDKSYNEDPKDDVIRDKLGSGAACQKFIACWYFESVSGKKTILSNAGFHPTFAGRSSGKVCADIPHYMWESMAEAGYQFMFIQGSQAAIGIRGNYTKAGYDWAKEKALSYEDWVERYGEKYASERFPRNDKDWGEEEYFDMRAVGYTLTHFIIDSIDKSNVVKPVYNVKMAETVIPLDYGIMYIAAAGAVFGYNTVKLPEAETGYGIVTEIGYVQIGEDVVMLMLPGEVSPAITFGAADGDVLWQGENSWTGEKWEYDTLENYAKSAVGSDKRILAMGIANDEIGYVMPDTDCAQNFLTKSLLASKGGVYERANNEELMETSRNAGSALVKGYRAFFGE